MLYTTLLQGSVCVGGSPSDVLGVRLERSSELSLQSASLLVVAASRLVSSDRACGYQALGLCRQSWVERVRPQLSVFLFPFELLRKSHAVGSSFGTTRPML